MGRAKLRMELIKTEKGRQATYQKRKIGLQKKSRELSTLCGVKVCMISYGPKENSPEIWPANDEIKELIKTYKSQACIDRRTRTVDVSHYFSDRQKKAEAMLSKIRNQNHEAKYPTWDYRYNDLSEQHLRNFANYLDGKIQAARARVAALKGKAPSTMTSYSDSGLLTDDHSTDYYSSLLEPSLPSGIMDINGCSSSYNNTNFYSNLLEPSLPSEITDINACSSSYNNTNYYSNLLEPSVPSEIMDINACSSSYNNTNYYSNLLESSRIMDNNISSSLYYNSNTNSVNMDAPNSYSNTSTTNANQLSDSEFLESLTRKRSMQQLEVLNPQPLYSVNGQVQDTINHAPQQGVHGGLAFDTNNALQFMNPSMMMMPINNNEPSGSNFMYAPMIGPIYYDPTSLESMSTVPIPMQMPMPMPTPTPMPLPTPTPMPLPTPTPMPLPMPTPMPMPMCYLAAMTLPGQFMPPQYGPYPSGTVEGSGQLHAPQPNGFYQVSDFSDEQLGN